MIVIGIIIIISVVVIIIINKSQIPFDLENKNCLTAEQTTSCVTTGNF